MHRARVVKDAVAQHGHHLAALQAFAHPQQSLGGPLRDDARGEFRRQRPRPPARMRRVGLVHHEIDRESMARLADHAQHFEAAQMRAEQQAAALRRKRGGERLGAVDADLESRRARIADGTLTVRGAD